MHKTYNTILGKKKSVGGERRKEREERREGEQHIIFIELYQ